jgi:hypothetical protein
MELHRIGMTTKAQSMPFGYFLASKHCFGENVVHKFPNYVFACLIGGDLVSLAKTANSPEGFDQR